MRRVGSFFSLGIRQDEKLKQLIFILGFIIHAHKHTSLLARKHEGKNLALPLQPAAVASWAMAWEITMHHQISMRPSTIPEKLRIQIRNSNKRSIQLRQMTATSVHSSQDGHICLQMLISSVWGILKWDLFIHAQIPLIVMPTISLRLKKALQP